MSDLTDRLYLPSATHAPLYFPDYKTTRLRSPSKDLILIPERLGEITGPVFGDGDVTSEESDMTIANGGEAIGQRIIVHGQVRDSNNKPVPDTLIEVWQANAAGRYRHRNDSWPAPLDPHFNGVARTLTDAQGNYEFTTIKPGAYPWGNHHNAWRPAHIHFSLFGRAYTERLVTQMYFPDDPFFFQDPIYNAVPEAARERMIATFDYDATRPDWALGFRFDIVLRGASATPFEEA
ncbi:protocatechuate 3,4-dioxygenase subunit beta [Gordonia amarae]|uniref:Protocatechuate 3,4-dioxygenase subunit beta n=3 Tax=Gordonia amarae TaxID=36821 RepID=A0A857MBK2_9ACTN|nr:protocatechuate 3,4-dioxygenase subunit beta [Gordonia amarae]MCS3877866.1 protocatechuate 3,4-dioxygenase beta subunit [Gordonia amarae]QHN16588.1 protocatechuate 3,4-dioxygenase subunit beta [Gordonia amarae]QHN21113.1 protocatechuate 3,4-dioxygenase subunit beta [Gordonia amarae]QHN29966.1 protocatechuate 3,4-dioxygenase subunit beta [Gordonia amarae]QHN38741.1 protocatechuate 3,4-dioxygenase subunit beta [Gordonia amarae]